MAVRIDDRRHHGLAGQIDAGRARRDRHLALPADLGEAVALDDERGVFDRRAAVPGDQPRTLKYGHARRLGCTRR